MRSWNPTLKVNSEVSKIVPCCFYWRSFPSVSFLRIRQEKIGRNWKILLEQSFWKTKIRFWRRKIKRAWYLNHLMMVFSSLDVLFLLSNKKVREIKSEKREKDKIRQETVEIQPKISQFSVFDLLAAYILFFFSIPIFFCLSRHVAYECSFALLSSC